MSARDELYAALTKGVKHAQLRQHHIDAYRAEVLSEAAAIADEFTARFSTFDAMRAAGIIGPHSMAAAIRNELRRMADEATTGGAS